MVGTTSNWEDELRGWLKPFLDRLGHKSRRRMCPLYVAGLIGPGDRKSVQPMAERLAPSRSDAPPLLEFGEKAFDAPAVPISDFVVSVLISAMAAGWNDRLAALVEDHIVKLVRIIGAISDDLTGG